MLNISNNSIADRFFDHYRAVRKTKDLTGFKYFNRFLFFFFLGLIVVLFLRWTQNVTGKGYVTTRDLSARPQVVQSFIAGKIEAWYVREGDSVKKGDTLLRLSEIKNKFQDPLLVSRTQDQIALKEQGQQVYQQEFDAIEAQIEALSSERKLKERSIRNKKLQLSKQKASYESEIMTLEQKEQTLQVQYDRNNQLLQEGLIPRKELEQKRLKLQETTNKLVQKKNDLKILNAKNQALIIDQQNILPTYTQKVQKLKTKQFSITNKRLKAQADISKQQTLLSGYEQRQQLNYILAPFSGRIQKALKVGTGNTVKSGEKLLRIVPSNYELIVETFILPMDYPLVHVGSEARIRFDGWPAIVFNGWPDQSFGTFTGRVIAKENFISKNGKFRILIAAKDPIKEPWPDTNLLSIGSGAQTVSLLKDVPVWYELWRYLNGFPPDYYKPKSDSKSSKKDKDKSKKDDK